MRIERIAVIGAGLMGAGIAQEFATHGFAVTLTDSSAEGLARSAETMQTNLSLLAERGLLREAPEEALRRITRHDSVAETVREADLVIEAVSENLEVKQRLFAE